MMHSRLLLLFFVSTLLLASPVFALFDNTYLVVKKTGGGFFIIDANMSADTNGMILSNDGNQLVWWTYPTGMIDSNWQTGFGFYDLNLVAHGYLTKGMFDGNIAPYVTHTILKTSIDSNLLPYATLTNLKNSLDGNLISYTTFTNLKNSLDGNLAPYATHTILKNALDSNLISYPNYTAMKSAIDSNIATLPSDDTNYSTAWGTFDTNMKNQFRLYAVDLNTSKSFGGVNGTFSGNVGIGTVSPLTLLQIGGGTFTSTNFDSGNKGLGIIPNVDGAVFVLEGNARATLHLVDAGATANQRTMLLRTDGGLTKFLSTNDAGTVNKDNILVLEHNTGNVGIGTTAPGAKLHTVQSADTALATFESTFADSVSAGQSVTIKGSNSNTDAAYVGNRAPALVIQNTNGTANTYGVLSFVDAGDNSVAGIVGRYENDANNQGSLAIFTRPSGGSVTEKVRITSTGNVGIGTTAPLGNLHVAGTGNTSLLVEGGVAGTPQIVLKQTTTARGYLYYAAGLAALKLNEDGSDAGGITIKNGNVGIGTTSPQNKLNVVGDVNISGTTSELFVHGTGNSYFMGNVGIGTTAPSEKLDIASASGNVWLSGGGDFMVEAGHGMAYALGGAGESSVRLATGITLKTANTARVTVNNAGNVGIGTTSPGYKLDINSGGAAIALYVDTNISADDYITRTKVYDKTQGTALSKLKDATAYLNQDGTVNHNAFTVSKVQYNKKIITGYENKVRQEQEPYWVMEAQEVKTPKTITKIIDENIQIGTREVKDENGVTIGTNPIYQTIKKSVTEPVMIKVLKTFSEPVKDTQGYYVLDEQGFMTYEDVERLVDEQDTVVTMVDVNVQKYRTINVNYEEPIYGNIVESGVSVGSELALVKQALYELKQCVQNSKDIKALNECIK